ncbi:hypothetical protein HaLaN_07975 [Haematococcus lacustris]|uniref:Uncharacterized protein n=1 Tax=Haematococcus lacustris TaxID=44745 RepID=A0A699YXR9_HAELA|nr:hypothetical protein HaLaN_07975 [Haematococcus lacustris]
MNVNAQEGSGVGGLNVANAPGGIGGAGTAVGIDFEVALGLSVSVTLGDQVQLTQSLTLLGDQLGFALAPGILGGPGATGAGAGVGLGGGPGVVVAGRRQTLEQDPDSSRPNATRERSIQLSVGFASTVSQSASFDLSDTLAALQTQVQDTLMAGRKRRQQRMNAMMQARAGMRNGANGNDMMGMESGLNNAVMG